MPANIRPVGRKRINDETTPARFPKGTHARVDALLEGKETRADFIRRAVDREIEWRQKIHDAAERLVRRREAEKRRG